jgi:hypothetical protein
MRRVEVRCTRERPEANEVTSRFKVGDHVTWNSEAGRVSGRIIEVHTKNVDYYGYTHHASPDEPQYAIASDKTGHVAMHKGSALRKVGDRAKGARRIPCSRRSRQ